MGENLSVIQEMKSLGLSEYEVKAYLSLLEKNPLNGYSLSKESGIPRSRIYEVLDMLKSKGMVFEQSDEKTTVYYPLEPKLLISKLEKSFTQTLSSVDKYVNSIYNKKEQKNTLTILEGREKIIEALNLLISHAQKRIALSIWEEEVKEIEEELIKAKERGVIIKGIYFGTSNTFNELTPHRDIETYLKEKKERYMTVTIDGEHALYGVISRGENSRVTWTQDESLIDVSEDYICHDLMVNEYFYQLNEKKQDGYENLMNEVRKDYFGYSDI